MKNLLCGFGLMVVVSACNQNNKSLSKKDVNKIYTDKNSTRYVCPMDTDVVKNKPGVCLKCGMKLVKQ